VPALQSSHSSPSCPRGAGYPRRLDRAWGPYSGPAPHSTRPLARTRSRRVQGRRPAPPVFRVRKDLHRQTICVPHQLPSRQRVTPASGAARFVTRGQVPGARNGAISNGYAPKRVRLPNPRRMRWGTPESSRGVGGPTPGPAGETPDRAVHDQRVQFDDVAAGRTGRRGRLPQILLVKVLQVQIDCSPLPVLVLQTAGRPFDGDPLRRTHHPPTSASLRLSNLVQQPLATVGIRVVPPDPAIGLCLSRARVAESLPRSRGGH
jgi:hypothetical protein